MDWEVNPEIVNVKVATKHRDKLGCILKSIDADEVSECCGLQSAGWCKPGPPVAILEF